MFILVTFTVLLSAASALDVPIETDANPVVELNNYVKDTYETCYSCQDNFADVMKTLSSPKQLNKRVSHKAGELAQVVSELAPMDSEQLCNKASLDKLRDILTAVVRIEPTSFSETNRELALNRYLRDYTKTTFKRCMKKFDDDFESVRGPNRGSIEGLSLLITDGFKKVDKSKIEYIRVANEFDDTKFTNMVKNIHCKNKPSGCSLTDGKSSINWTQMQAYLKDYLYGPCEKFLGNKGVQNVLEQVIAVSEAALQVEYYPKMSLPRDSLDWAAASVACKSLTKDKLYPLIGRITADLGNKAVRSWQ